MEKLLQRLVAEIQSRQLAAVTKPKPPLDQLEDLLRRLPANRAAPVPVPAPVQEVPTVEKLLQHLVAEIQSRQLAAVTKPKPPLDQLEDLLRRLPANRAAPVPVPAPVQEVPTVEKLLQRLVAEIQSRQLAAVMKPKPPLDQLEDLLRRLPANRAAPVPVPAPVQEGPTVEWLQQRLVEVEIVPLRTTDIETTDSAEISQKG